MQASQLMYNAMYICSGYEVSAVLLTGVNKHRTLKTLYDLGLCIMYELGR